MHLFRKVASLFVKNVVLYNYSSYLSLTLLKLIKNHHVCDSSGAVVGELTLTLARFITKVV